MAASQTLPHRPQLRNGEEAKVSGILVNNLIRIAPRSGVITLFGYGIQVKVERGHLILKDGVGCDRREGRFARVNHGIKRVTVIGADGIVSLAALRWLADQRASFVMLDRSGSVLAATGPVSASDARLRRAQSCVLHSDAALPVVQELILRKLEGQRDVALEKLGDSEAANRIQHFIDELGNTKTISDVRLIESQGSASYWSAWRSVRIQFPASETRKIPEHWKVFGSRTSPISGGARNAANPANAVLNYLYAILEAETRLTISALGLDPGIGLLHIDKPNRDSLACDLMEPVRPNVDAFLLDWIAHGPLHRNWFFEQRDGTCRLMPILASRLSETALVWRREIAPLTEWFAEAIRSTSPDSDRLPGPQTRLTRTRWRETMRKHGQIAKTDKALRPESLCATCGAVISRRNRHCKACAVTVSTQALVEGARAGRRAAMTPEALARRRENSRRQNEELQAWNPEGHPSWLTADVYAAQVQPRLAGYTRPAIAAALGVSVVYAGEVRNGTCVPHRRHWLKLAQLVEVSRGK